MSEEIIIQDDKGKKYCVLRVLDADTKKIIDDLSALVVKKNKMIDLMAKTIDNYDSQLEINYFKDVEHIKQYFKEYAEEEV